ncbi:TFIIIC subunit 6 family protein [Aspergillus fumigatus Af293]
MQSPSESILVLDPAMLTDDDHDSDYEYEYHEVDTETFYLNLDLTSLHGPIRPPRRRDPASSTAAASTTLTPTDDHEPAMDSTEPDNVLSERVQILGLHTTNPIVSYQNQIFSCTWADQIGTELLFTRPETGHEPDIESALPQISPLRSGSTQEPSIQTVETSANVFRKTGPQSNQARFLERLMHIKRQRGETDTVRTVFSTKRTQNLEDRLRGWARTEEELAEVQRLSEAASRGDTVALTALEELYTEINGQKFGPGISDEPTQPC